MAKLAVYRSVCPVSSQCIDSVDERWDSHPTSRSDCFRTHVNDERRVANCWVW